LKKERVFFFRGFCPRLLGQLAGEIRDEFFVFAQNKDLRI